MLFVDVSYKSASSVSGGGDLLSRYWQQSLEPNKRTDADDDSGFNAAAADGDDDDGDGGGQVHRNAKQPALLPGHQV